MTAKKNRVPRLKPSSSSVSLHRNIAGYYDGTATNPATPDLLLLYTIRMAKLSGLEQKL